MTSNTTRIKKRPLALRASAVAALALLGACVGDGDTLLPDRSATGGAMFARYVALGNSITAGYQSGGLNDSLQVRAYPVLLAQRMGTGFESPLVARPGCPRPFTAPLGAAGRVGAADSCERINNPRFTHNVAVPGARVLDLIRFPPGQTGQLQTLLLGPRTQLQAMRDANPTFVSVWIGNNDALEATLGGVLGPLAAGADSALTPLATFQGRLAVVVDSIRAVAPQGAMLIGVVNAIAGAPLIQPGAYFFASRDAQGRFQGKPVNPNCSPVTALGELNPLSRNMVSFQIVGDANFPEINCDPNAYPAADPRRGVYLLDTQEQAIVAERVNRYNAAIQAAAQANGWLYVNPNDILLPFLAQRDAQGRAQALKKCQDLATAATPLQLQAAVLNTCPVDPANFFGTLMSFDGVHPSTEAHRILAREFAIRINTHYGTALATN
jgi:lysophospholipase L1-like esterase